MELATEKFKIGQRVRMTKEALDAGLDGPIVKRNTGVVKGFPAQGIGDIRLLVYILRDGNKTKECYHMKFWEPINAPNIKN